MNTDQWELIDSWQTVIKRNRCHLVQHLAIDESVLDELISDELITSAEEDNVLAEKTQRGKNRNFAKILAQKKPADIKKITQIFNKCGKTAASEGLEQLVKDYLKILAQNRINQT